MARMHSRRKGKSGSKKPLKTKKVTWLRHQPSEIESLVVKIAKTGKSPSLIGLELRDSYGIPLVRQYTNRKITKILEDNGIKAKIPEDMAALIRKEINILRHLESNRKDMPTRRGLLLTESKIKRLTKYYKRIGKLSPDWTYSRENIKLLLE